MSIHAYHFVGDTLFDGRPVPPDGEWLEHDGPIEICTSGLHASRRPWHALTYAPGPILCLVEVDQVFEERHDKLVARRRRIVRRTDLTADLRVFARQCARDVLHLWDAPDMVRRYLDTGDDSLREAAWTAAWDAVSAAAGDITRKAVWGAARAARGAIENAVWVAMRAAWDAAARDAWDAARAASWEAAWATAYDAARATLCAVCLERETVAAYDAARDTQGERFDALCAARLNAPRLTREDSNGPAALEPRHCPTCRHHEVDDKGDHWCALGISTAGRVTGLVTHLQPFGCSKHEGKETT